ncbi:MAG: flagellar biosynthesis protein FlhA [Thermoguttaceae bacterium]|nr:flagellar biosynthesis protein FlhA [Thermoguttaceae bacterium]
MARYRWENILRLQDILVPLALVASLFIILVTLPSPIMDFLLSLNIALGIIIHMTTFFVRKPLEFSIFPTILLAVTLFRLVLNIATTRLIMTRGGEFGDLAAGQVIKAFSSFVTGESLVVGVVIFAIFIVIQFVVITKGATRISEVAARFTLDAMPGRQMAIDADLNAGIITEEEARLRRDELTEQADFFGAMDGASKFVRGDAIASVIITIFNILGGLFVGVIQSGMPLEQALGVYTKLTIGDGLVTQIPALLISLATGILVTRSSRSKNLPRLVVEQVFFRPVVLVLAGAFLIGLSTTGLPILPLGVLSLGCFGLAFLVHREQERKVIREREEQSRHQKDELSRSSGDESERIENYLMVDPMELEIGSGLVPLADPAAHGDLMQRIGQIRKELASQLGLVLPRVRIRDSLNLDVNQYRIKINGEQVALGMVYPNMCLAVNTGTTQGELTGLQTKDPVGGVPAVWIEPSKGAQAEKLGYRLRRPVAIIEDHLAQTARREADELLTRDAVRHLIDELKTTSPTVVSELIPTVMKLAEVQQVLQRLLKERVSIRQLGLILETLGDSVAVTKNPILLTERVRQRLARTLCAPVQDEDGVIHAVMPSPELEERIAQGFDLTDFDMTLHFPPAFPEALVAELQKQLNNPYRMDCPIVLLTSEAIRPVVRRLTEYPLPELTVLSHKEIPVGTRVVPEGMIDVK